MPLLTWPIPALLTWALAWALFFLLRWAEAPVIASLALPSLLGAVLSVLGSTRWRRVFIALGFPLSALASGLGGVLPAWSWLLPLAVLLALYPLNAWRDAPVFPTPRGALQGLAKAMPLPTNARIADAGCGLGDGLRELRAAYPEAHLEGWEWSWPLAALCALRSKAAGWNARVRRADIWQTDWSHCDAVYLFQRPESLPRAIDKATREMRPGTWLASLEFEATGMAPIAVHRCPDGRPVWLYRLPLDALDQRNA